MYGPVLKADGHPIPIVNYPSVWIGPSGLLPKRCRTCKRKASHPVYIDKCEDCWVDQYCPKGGDKKAIVTHDHLKSEMLSK